MRHSDIVYNLVGRDYETKYVGEEKRRNRTIFIGIDLGFLETLLLNRCMWTVRVQLLKLVPRLVWRVLFKYLP